MSSVRLNGASLSGADLYGVNLCGAIIIRAHLNEANLSVADLRYSDLREANLSGAIICDADLRFADLWRTYLSYANLSKTDLSGADLNGANLGWSDLKGANLRCACLRGAQLYGADLRMAKNVPYVPINCPSECAFVAWKKVAGKLVKLEIPEDAKRTSATTMKCRCDKAKVLSITDLDGSNPINEILNIAQGHELLYKVGEMVYPDSFDEDRWNECSNGIHFFVEKVEAVNYEF
jgi:hypothetical protein